MLEKTETTLNKQQLEAVSTTEGPVRVLAGPGTGKTKTLAHRYVHLVNDLFISPGNILCVTFTKDATREMHDRIRTLIGNKDLSLICTFHSLCYRIIKEDYSMLGFSKCFDVLMSSTQESILSEVYKEKELTKYDMSYGEAYSVISKRKNEGNDYIELMTAKDDAK